MIETLLTLILFLFLSSAWCFGFHVVMKKLILLQILKWDIDKDWDKLGPITKFILKPIFACPYCMGSVHGFIIYMWFLYGHFYIFGLAPFCICLCGLNYIVNGMIDHD